MAITANHTMIGAHQSSSACLMADVQQCGETCSDATELIRPHLSERSYYHFHMRVRTMKSAAAANTASQNTCSEVIRVMGDPRLWGDAISRIPYRPGCQFHKHCAVTLITQPDPILA
jgi:hypothetical protein